MFIKHLFVPLGVDSTPIGQRKRIIDPMIGSALITGGTGLLGSLLGIDSQKKANEANLQATRETNQMNYQIAREANQMSQEQFYQNLNWLKKQYYDTDSYARLRQNLAQGGLNPALAYGSASPVGSVGQASPTSFHAAQMEAGHVDPISYDGLFDSVGSAVNAYFQNQLLSNQAENVGADTQIKQAQAFTEFASRVADIRSKYAEIEYKLAQKGVSEATREKLLSEKDEIDSRLDEFWSLWDERQKAAKYGNKILERQEQGLNLENSLRKIELAFKPRMLSLGVKLSQSQINLFNKQAALVVEQTYTEFENGQIANKKAFEQVLRNRLLEMDYNNKTFKNAVRDGSKATRIVYWYADYLSDILFGNLGKVLK